MWGVLRILGLHMISRIAVWKGERGKEGNHYPGSSLGTIPGSYLETDSPPLPPHALLKAILPLRHAPSPSASMLLQALLAESSACPTWRQGAAPRADPAAFSNGHTE